MSLITIGQVKHEEMYTGCALKRDADPRCPGQAQALSNDEFMTVAWYQGHGYVDRSDKMMTGEGIQDRRESMYIQYNIVYQGPPAISTSPPPQAWPYAGHCALHEGSQRKRPLACTALSLAEERSLVFTCTFLRYIVCRWHCAHHPESVSFFYI